MIRPLLALLLLAGPALAQGADFVEARGKLSPLDFYRLVSCAAPPGGPCGVEPVRWPPARARDLRVALAPAPPGFPRDLARAMSAALDAAIGEINGAGAALRLARAPKGEGAPITVHLAAVGEGEAIRGTGVEDVDGEVIGAALVTVWWDDAGLSEAAIVLARDLPLREAGPVMLEELAQAMGLMTDIRNPLYEGVSVFSEDSNEAAKLSAQDRDALRRHYPPGAAS